MLSNPRAADFYLYASYEIPTWLPIVRALRERDVDARFVLEPPGRNMARGSSSDPASGWRDTKDRSRLVHLVDDPTYRQLRDRLDEHGEVALDRLRPAAAAVTSSGIGWLRAWSGARIRCMYGVGLVLDAYGHGPINQGFDLILALGPFSAREIHDRVFEVRAEAVGYPKWAAHRRAPEPAGDARTRLGVPQDDPVVLWLPTWADHSSLDRYAEAALDLADEHTVLLKPHHNTWRFERSRLDALVDASGGRLRVVPANHDLVELAAAADVVVSDVRSGGLTEGLLAGRPVVALQDDSTTPDRIHPAATGLTTCDNPSGLAAAVTEALGRANDPTLAALVTDLFGPGDGDDDTRAADAIVNTMERLRRSPLRRAEALWWRTAYRTVRRLGR